MSRACNDYVIVALDEDTSTTYSGILVKPEGAMEDVNRTGVVLSIGPGKHRKGKRVPLVGISPGDKVIFVRFTATERDALGRDNALVQYTDILGVVET